MWDLTLVQPSHRPVITPMLLSPVLFYHCQLTSLALVIRYPKELDDQPWNEYYDDWYSSPPPPTPLPFAIEMEAKSHNQTKISGYGLSKSSVLHSRMDCYRKIWHNSVALEFRFCEQLKTWTPQRKRYCVIIILGASRGTLLSASGRKDTLRCHSGNCRSVSC